MILTVLIGSASVAQLDVRQTGDQKVANSTPSGWQHSFMEIDHEIFFYGNSTPSADSRRAVVSFWQKNVHNTGEQLTGLSLPSKRVVK